MMPFLSFLIFFALYAGSAFPAFGSDQAAELLAAVAANGVPPPPAQTLAWLLAKISLWIPFGSPGYRANLLAAALMAATVPLVASLLERLSPPKEWAPFAHQELERERWLSTACWLTALLWGLSAGPWRSALSLGADTVGLFLTVLAFRFAAAERRDKVFTWTAFLAGLACGQWPVAFLTLPGMILLRSSEDGGRVPPFTRLWFWRILGRALAFAAGLAPAAGTILLSLRAPLLDFGSPDTWSSWANYSLTRAPFSPPALDAAGRTLWPSIFRSLGGVYTLPGAALWLFGFFRLARSRPLLFQAAAVTALLPGPILLLASRPFPDPTSPPQAAVWGLCALGLSVPFLWGYHRAGVRHPAARTALAALLPLSLAARLPSAARNDVALRDRAENVMQSLPSGSVLWNPTAPGALFYAQFIAGRRTDVHVVRRPEAVWARAEYRRRYPVSGHPSPYVLSPDLFFLDLARDAGAENIFTDDSLRLPEVDPATGLPAIGRYPEDALPSGAAFQFLPADSHRLVAPAAQISLARVPFWAFRTGDPEGIARARMALSIKLDQYGLGREAEEEALSALAFDPGLPDAHRRLGETALERGDDARAAVHFQRALIRDPRRADLWSFLARAARQKGDLAATATAARTALALDPSLVETRRLLAETLEEGNRWRSAAENWRILMEGIPDERLYIWRLARAEARSNRSDKAKAALREYFMFPLSPEEKEQAEALENSLEVKH